MPVPALSPPVQSRERLLSTGGTATRFHVSRRSVERYIADGLLPAVRTPGGHFRVRVEDIEALLAQIADGELAR